MDTNKKGHIQTATPRFFLVNTLSPAWLSPSSGRFDFRFMVEKMVESEVLFFTQSNTTNAFKLLFDAAAGIEPAATFKKSCHPLLLLLFHWFVEPSF